jgi:hypothetical protein
MFCIFLFLHLRILFLYPTLLFPEMGVYSSCDSLERLQSTSACTAHVNFAITGSHNELKTRLYQWAERIFYSGEILTIVLIIRF